MKIEKAHSINGQIQVPGDKSISHRAAIIAAMSNGTSVIDNYSDGEDCLSTLSCLRQLGVEMERAGPKLKVRGVGPKGFLTPNEPLDCGNSGTTMRLLAGSLVGQRFNSQLTGDSSLRSRPMRRIIAPLTDMGAIVESNDGRAPLSIRGTEQMRGITYEMPVASAQLKSCLLLAGLLAEGTTTVIESEVTRDHTERMLRHFGVELIDEVFATGHGISVKNGSHLSAKAVSVPGDISSAAFFIAAAAALSDSQLVIDNLGLNPSRTRILDVFRDLGVDLTVESSHIETFEPVGSVTIRGGLSNAAQTEVMVLEGSDIAAIIDEIPILAVLATQTTGGIEFRNAGELRHKETDRIAAVAENLRSMGAAVTEYDDGLRVDRSELHRAKVNSFGDHRIAMAFAIAGFFSEGGVEIFNADVVKVSFPSFFETLASVVR